mgnify:CR=1 FL=1
MIKMPDEKKGKEGTSTEKTTAANGRTYEVKDSTPGYSTTSFLGCINDPDIQSHYTVHAGDRAYVTDKFGETHAVGHGSSSDSGSGDGGNDGEGGSGK